MNHTKELIKKIAGKLSTHGVDIINFNRNENISILSNCIAANKLISTYNINEDAVIEELKYILS
jgi:hypothetical protein